MIRLTRINHVPLVLNSDLIEHIEATPDTVISLTTGRKLMVRESSEDIIHKVIDFRRDILRGLERLATRPALSAVNPCSTDGDGNPRSAPEES